MRLFAYFLEGGLQERQGASASNALFQQTYLEKQHPSRRAWTELGEDHCRSRLLAKVLNFLPRFFVEVDDTRCAEKANQERALQKLASLQPVRCP